MRNKNKELTLYNVLFPLWMLMLFPIVWLIVLPGNFIIDSIVLIVALNLIKYPEKKLFYKKHIFTIYAFGLLADLFGAAFLMVTMFVFQLGTMGDELYLTLPATVISAVLIFIFNYFVTFKMHDKNLRFKLSLTFSIVTAPYTFMTPSSWIYGF